MLDYTEKTFLDNLILFELSNIRVVGSRNWWHVNKIAVHSMKMLKAVITPAVSYHLGCEEIRLLLCCGFLGMKTWLLLAAVYVCEQAWEGWQGPIPTGYCADGLTICGLIECCGTMYEGWQSLQWESQWYHVSLYEVQFGTNISTHVWKRHSTEKQQCYQNIKQFQTQQQCIPNTDL